MKKIIDTAFSRAIVLMVAAAVGINICIELLSRGSISSLIAYITQTPFTFIFNTAIILFTISVALFFKQRIFVASFICLLWVVLGVANKFMLISGNTPLTVFHLANIESAVKLSSIYMTTFEIILIIFAIIVAIAGGIFLWRKSPKAVKNIKKALLTFAILFLSCALMSSITSANSPDFTDVSSAYEQYGFAYCFSYSVLNSGIKQPVDYSEEKIAEITAKIDIPDSQPEVKPNVIFVQLESFFDVKDLKNVEFSQDPIPNFTKLKGDFPSGYLTVSSVGGGTANTEFEIMTGISLSHFSIGEYPYLTMLTTKPCESIMRNLSEYGYTSTAIHSYTGTFYKRNEVFKNLGFDRFISEEFMAVNERNILSWAKDSQITPYIKETLTSTEGPDFIYTITVQSHGKYLTEEPETPYTITSNIDDEIIKPQMDYYANQINEVDTFIGDLVKTYENYPEPTVIVFFGDHLPALDIKNEELNNGDVYKTEYVIWSNFEIEAEDENLEAEYLSAHVTSLLNLTNGKVNKLNTYCREDETFNKMAEMLNYDILFGTNYANTKTYTPTEMTMGLGLIKVDSYYFEDSVLYVKGKNFNQNSKITIDGNVKNDTEFIDENTLRVNLLLVLDSFTLSVAQVSNANEFLGTANRIICEVDNPLKALIN